MELTNYNMEDLLLAAIKSEINAKNVYTRLAESIRNAFLEDKMNFLAEEEKKHEEKLRGVYGENFPEKEIVLPEETPVPLPNMILPDEQVPLTSVLENAMEAEMAAHDFYTKLSDMFENPNTRATLAYLAAMEMGHYRLLEIEKEIASRFEEFDVYEPMMHSGP